jgi:hypothetical protein
MHCEHSPETSRPTVIRACGYCFKSFLPRRPWAKYCSTACRNEAAAKKATTGMRGVVSRVSTMKRGGVSVVLRFGLEERDRVLKLEPGKVVGVELP